MNRSGPNRKIHQKNDSMSVDPSLSGNGALGHYKTTKTTTTTTTTTTIHLSLRGLPLPILRCSVPTWHRHDVCIWKCMLKCMFDDVACQDIFKHWTFVQITVFLFYLISPIRGMIGRSDICLLLLPMKLEDQNWWYIYRNPVDNQAIRNRERIHTRKVLEFALVGPEPQ